MKTFIYSLICFIFLSCSNDPNPPSNTGDNMEASTRCKYSKPFPLFTDSLEAILTQSFESSGQNGVETVMFSDSSLMELYQGGCNEVRQEYRFYYNEDYRTQADSFWIQQAVEKLSFVGNLDQRYAVLGIWVGAIDHLSEELTIGQFSEAEPNTFIMIDKVTEPESSILMVVLERRI